MQKGCYTPRTRLVAFPTTSFSHATVYGHSYPSSLTAKPRNENKAISNRIFDPFYITEPVDIGTGRGVSATCFIITHHQDGTMEMYFKPDRAIRFSLHLPLEKTETYCL